MNFQYICNNPRTIEAESRDCVVRALSLAFNRAYPEVHEVCAKAGRKPRRGMMRAQTDKAIQVLSANKDAKREEAQREDRRFHGREERVGLGTRNQGFRS